MPPIRQNNTFLNTGQENRQDLNPANPFKTLGVIFLIVSVLLSVTSYLVLSFTESKNVKIENNIKSIETSLTNVPLSEMLVFYNKIRSINSVLKSHYYVTTHLATLSDAVESSTYFKNYNFTVKEKGDSEITFSGVTTNESNVVRQIDLFKSDKYSKFIKSLELKSVSKDQFDNILFDLKLTIDSTVKPDYIISENLRVNTPVKNIIQTNSTSTNGTGTQVQIGFDSVVKGQKTVSSSTATTTATTSIIKR